MEMFVFQRRLFVFAHWADGAVHCCLSFELRFGAGVFKTLVIYFVL